MKIRNSLTISFLFVYSYNYYGDVIMKTVVITGSGRGFGLEMIKEFRLRDFNVVLCDVNEESLKISEQEVIELPGKGKVLAVAGDITKEEDVTNIINKAVSTFKTIDIWINNAGVNQKMTPVWDIEEKTVNRLIDVDLKGTIICSKEIMKVFKSQGYGSIYNVEGFGSNEEKQVGLSLYGTAKRGLTYFTDALTFEVKKSGLNIIVGKITPGIMITNFIDTSLGDGDKFELNEKTKNIYNILGDYPETIAKWTVERVVKNNKNGAKIMWLTKTRAMGKFLKATFKKNDYFSNNK